MLHPAAADDAPRTMSLLLHFLPGRAALPTPTILPVDRT